MGRAESFSTMKCVNVRHDARSSSIPASTARLPRARTCARMRERARAHTHMRAHARTHTCARTRTCSRAQIGARAHTAGEARSVSSCCVCELCVCALCAVCCVLVLRVLCACAACVLGVCCVCCVCCARVLRCADSPRAEVVADVVPRDRHEVRLVRELRVAAAPLSPHAHARATCAGERPCAQVLVRHSVRLLAGMRACA
jgi:hypothetical protein